MKTSTGMYLFYNKHSTQLHYLQHYIHQYDDTCKGEASFSTIIYLPLCIFVKILPDDDHNDWNTQHNYAEIGCL